MTGTDRGQGARSTVQPHGTARSRRVRVIGGIRARDVSRATRPPIGSRHATLLSLTRIDAVRVSCSRAPAGRCCSRASFSHCVHPLATATTTSMPAPRDRRLLANLLPTAQRHVRAVALGPTDRGRARAFFDCKAITAAGAIRAERHDPQARASPTRRSPKASLSDAWLAVAAPTHTGGPRCDGRDQRSRDDRDARPDEPGDQPAAMTRQAAGQILRQLIASRVPRIATSSTAASQGANLRQRGATDLWSAASNSS